MATLRYRAGLALLGLCALAGCGGLGKAKVGDGADAGNNDDSAPIATGTIGPAGGVASGDGAQVTIGPNALASEESISISVVTTDIPALPSDLTLLSPVYAFQPHGLMFTAPVTVRVNLSRSAPPGAVPQFITADLGGDWGLVPGATIDGSGATAEITHFSFFVVVAPAVNNGGTGGNGSGGNSGTGGVVAGTGGNSGTGGTVGGTGGNAGTGGTVVADAGTGGAGADAAVDMPVEKPPIDRNNPCNREAFAASCCGSLNAKEDAVNLALGCNATTHSAADTCNVLYANFKQCSEQFAAFYTCFNATPPSGFSCLQGQPPMLKVNEHCTVEDNAFLVCEDG